ncbi:MAG: protein-arginine deiminase family protein [Planctomycetota bacterium]|jgi:protein-arginine deiminase
MSNPTRVVASLLAVLLLSPAARGDVPGTQGSAGVPVLTANAPVLGETFVVGLSSARVAAPAFLLWGAEPGPTPTGKGTLGLGGPLIMILAAGSTDGAGTSAALFPLPDDPALFGLPCHLQWAVKDPFNPTGVALSNSLSTALFAADLDVDTDRDGIVEVVSAQDDDGEETWGTARGAVFLHNADDDDGDGLVDAGDTIVNGEADLLDLAPVLVRGLPFLPPDWTGELLVDSASAGLVHLFRDEGAGVWSRFDPALHNPIAGAELAPGLAFGVEAVDFARSATGQHGQWDGEVDLTLVLRDGNGEARSQDVVCLRVAPFVLHNNLDPVQQVFVTKKTNTVSFVAALGAPVTAGGAVLAPIDGIFAHPDYDIWVQDAMEFGTSALPAPGGPRHLPVVLRSPRDWPLDPWTEDVWLGPDRGYAFKGAYRPGVDWIDWFGNLDCTPPLPGWPLGRVYTGYQGAVTMHPDVLAFLEAQRVQAPVLQIDTGWLLIGHVDEEVCFVPSQVGTPWRVLMPSTSMALDILSDLSGAGHGGLAVFAGQGDETTVDGLLNWSAFVAYNQACQASIDGVRQQVLDGFSLDPADVIDVPALFWTGGGTGRAIAHMPNMVNALVVGDRVITSDPFGPQVGGVDAFAQPLIDALSPLGLHVDLVDDWYPYHEWWGEVHCGTNARRDPPAIPWWTQP